MIIRVLAIGASLALAALTAFAQADLYPELEDLPSEVQPFVEKGTIPLFLAAADLNRDGLQDFVLVLEKQKAKESDPDIEVNQRPLLILLRQTGGALKEVKRNERIVYCSTCGGMMGDPFQGVEAGPGTFMVQHYGGSASRWSVDYKFNYSRRDKTWQLVRVTERSFHATYPDDVEMTISKPPRDFGKIDIAEFDPENWMGKGSK